MKQCYYELLEVTSDASSEDLKRAYRKKALQYHPDKNRENIDEATELFAQIRCAYEVLSDPQERAWYDSHKEQILNDKFYEEEEETNYNVDSSVTGVTTEELLRFFNGSLYTRNDDTPAGVYQIAGKVFAKIASDEIRWGRRLGMKDFVNYKDDFFDADINSIGYVEACEKYKQNTVLFPSFGSSKTEYHDVKSFYKKWGSFSTLKDFSWKDEYMYSKNYDRRTKREILKRNDKLRSQAKNEYNKTVKRFVTFIKKFDKRLKEGIKKSEEEKRRKLQTALDRQIAKERLSKEVSSAFELQDWQQVDEGQFEEIEKNFEDSGNVASSDQHQDDDYEEIVVFECFVCNKNFKSNNQLENHNKTKTHNKALRQLQFEMKQESIALGLDNISDVDEFDSALESEEDIKFTNELTNSYSLSLDEIDEKLSRIDLELKKMQDTGLSSSSSSIDAEDTDPFPSSSNNNISDSNVIYDAPDFDIEDEEVFMKEKIDHRKASMPVSHEQALSSPQTSDTELDRLLASLTADTTSWNSTKNRKKKKKKKN